MDMGRNGRPQVIERILKQLGDRLAGGKDGLETATTTIKKISGPHRRCR